MGIKVATTGAVFDSISVGLGRVAQIVIRAPHTE
jgi:hypothetical protein